MPLGQMCCALGVWASLTMTLHGQFRQDFVLKNCWGVCAVSVSSGCQAVALAVKSFEATNQGQFIRFITVTATQETSSSV